MLNTREKEMVASVLGSISGIDYDRNANTVADILASARLHGAPLDKRRRDIIRKGLRNCGIKDPPKQVRPGYRAFIEYIGENDDEGMIMQGDPSVLVSMVGHLFNKETDDVIRDVRDYLENQS
jgi:hypothetical protein